MTSIEWLQTRNEIKKDLKRVLNTSTQDYGMAFLAILKRDTVAFLNRHSADMRKGCRYDTKLSLKNLDENINEIADLIIQELKIRTKIQQSNDRSTSFNMIVM